jgi:hypothetical protein
LVFIERALGLPGNVTDRYIGGACDDLLHRPNDFCVIAEFNRSLLSYGSRALVAEVIATIGNYFELCHQHGRDPMNLICRPEERHALGNAKRMGGKAPLEREEW